MWGPALKVLSRHGVDSLTERRRAAARQLNADDPGHADGEGITTFNLVRIERGGSLLLAKTPALAAPLLLYPHPFEVVRYLFSSKRVQGS